MERVVKETTNVPRLKPQIEVHSEVKLVIEQVIGVATGAESAMGMIGSHWDNSPYGGPTKGFYTFDMDQHRFKVVIEPLEDTPFG